VARLGRLGALGAILLGAWLSGCVEPRRGSWEAASGPQPLVLEVRNNNFLDVVVYALPDGGRMRIGMVTGRGGAVLEIPESVAARTGFRLAVDPVGSTETYVTELMYASPGSVVVLEVGSVVSMSSWHLR